MKLSRDISHDYDYDDYDEYDDDYDYDGDGDGEGGSRRRIIRIALIVALLAVVAVVAKVGSGLLSNDDDTQSSASTPTTSANTAPSSTVTVGPSTTLVQSEPPTVPATATPRAAVESIRVVPAQRDVIVQINGVSLASDAQGQIAIPVDQRSGTISVIGLASSNVVQQLVFTGWSDGSTQPVRLLGDIAGPTVTMGFSVNSRIIVKAGGFATGSVTFSSAAGDVVVPVGTATWLPDTRAVPSAAGLVVQQLTYTSTAFSVGGGTLPLKAQQFTASPEAIWTVSG